MKSGGTNAGRRTGDGGGGGLKTATRSLHPKTALVLFRLMAHVKKLSLRVY